MKKFGFLFRPIAFCIAIAFSLSNLSAQSSILATGWSSETLECVLGSIHPDCVLYALGGPFCYLNNGLIKAVPLEDYGKCLISGDFYRRQY